MMETLPPDKSREESGEQETLEVLAMEKHFGERTPFNFYFFIHSLLGIPDCWIMLFIVRGFITLEPWKATQTCEFSFV